MGQQLVDGYFFVLSLSFYSLHARSGDVVLYLFILSFSFFFLCSFIMLLNVMLSRSPMSHTNTSCTRAFSYLILWIKILSAHQTISIDRNWIFCSFICCIDRMKMRRKILCAVRHKWIVSMTRSLETWRIRNASERTIVTSWSFF